MGVVGVVGVVGVCIKYNCNIQHLAATVSDTFLKALGHDIRADCLL